MNLFLTVLHVMVCFILIVVVLLQRGKGAEMGAVFGGGGSNTVFGSRGASSFLSKLTTWSTILFFVTSMSLSYLASRTYSSLFDEGSVNAPAAEGTVSDTAAEEAEAPAEAGGFEEVAPAESESSEQPAE